MMDENKPPVVTLEEITELAVRAFDADQQALAGVLYIVIEACSEMKLEQLFGVMICYRKGEIGIERREGDQWVKVT